MKYVILGVLSIAFVSCAQIKELEDAVGTLKSDLAKVQIDNDGDGVSDVFDLESNTPKGALVDGSGRALDLDGDGVRHELDTDPFTQRGARVDASGREIDTDGDGVLDSKDQEKNTPAGALVNFQGRKIETLVRFKGEKSPSTARLVVSRVVALAFTVTVVHEATAVRDGHVGGVATKSARGVLASALV